MPKRSLIRVPGAVIQDAEKSAQTVGLRYVSDELPGIRRQKTGNAFRYVDATGLQAIETVAKRLGNTPAICRKCYVHPAILDAYLDGSLAQTMRPQVETQLTQTRGKLQPDEAAVLKLLQVRVSRERRRSTHGNSGSAPNEMG